MAIARGRYQPPPRPIGKQLRINDFIRVSTVRLIGEGDEQIGIVDLVEAKRRAREVGLDLVEVAPDATPPVCRIMDYGKWKYSQKKKEQKARSHSKQSELKEVRLRPKTDDHDLDIKVNKAREFLHDGNKVQFTMLFRGREMAHREIGLRSLQAIRDKLVDCSKAESEPRLMGRRMTMVLSPERRRVVTPSAKPGAAPAPGAPAAPAAPKPAAAPAAAAPATPSAPPAMPRPPTPAPAAGGAGPSPNTPR